MEKIEKEINTPKSPEQKKWNNLSVQKCKAVWDIFTKIEKGANVALPEGKTVEELLHSEGDELLDFAEELAANNELWSQIPDSFKVKGGIIINKDELKAKLEELIQESR